MNNVAQDGSLDFSKTRRVPPPKRNLDSFLLRPGDVVFNATNSPDLVGKTAYFASLDEPTAFSNHFIRLRPDERRLDGKFLTRWLQLQFKRRLFKSMCRQWVNQATVGREALLALQMPLPPVPEQRRIAAVLDQADALRAKRHEALAQLNDLTQSIFLDVFGHQPTEHNWRKDVTLGEVADVASGITKGRKVNGMHTRSVPYLAVANVQDRGLDLSAVKTIEATELEIKRYKLEYNDLLLTEGGDPDKLGRGTLWRNEIVECIHQNHIFRVRLTSNIVTPMFLSWLVGSARGKRYFLRSAKQTTGIASINMKQLRNFPLLIPPLELQHKFARRVEAVERLKISHRTHLAELDELFASLQHRAFRSEL